MKINLAGKISFLVSLAIAASILILTFINSQTLRTVFEESRDKRVNTITKTLETSLANDILKKNSSNIKVIADSIKEQNSDMLFLGIYNIKNNPFAESGEPPKSNDKNILRISPALSAPEHT